MNKWFFDKYELKNMEEAIDFCAYFSSTISSAPIEVLNKITDKAKQLSIITCETCAPTLKTNGRNCAKCEYSDFEEKEIEDIKRDIHKFVLDNFSWSDNFIADGDLCFQNCYEESKDYIEYEELLNYYNSLSDNEKKLMDTIFEKMFAVSFSGLSADIVYNMLKENKRKELLQKAKENSEKGSNYFDSILNKDVY